MAESFHQHIPQTNANSELHPLSVESNSLSMKKAIVFFVVIIAAGLLSGFLLSGMKSEKKVASTTSSEQSTDTNTKVVGLKDKATFKDSAEGMLKEGGIEGEGNFHLERPGGVSQNVYLTSATVDLSLYIGKKVKVWGQTINSQKAGWLMDVGLVESE